MNGIDKATQTQLANIQSKTGKTLEQLYVMIQKSGLTKHGEIRGMLQKELGLGYGDANALGLTYKKAQAPPNPDGGDELAQIYSGAKAELRPIHEHIMKELAKLGAFEIAPKKGYVSLRRAKQFAMIGPATNQRVEVGINIKGLQAGERLREMPAGGMCQYKVYLMQAKEVDSELMGWLQLAYERAG